MTSSLAGNGAWRVLPKMDHGFALHQSMKESVTHEFDGPFGEQVVQDTVRWIQEVLAGRRVDDTLRDIVSSQP